MGTVKAVNAEHNIHQHNINIQSDHIYKHILMSKQMQKKNDNKQQYKQKICYTYYIIVHKILKWP